MDGHELIFYLHYEGGKAAIEVREMSKIALERCTTAKEAVLLMGSLAEQYGFYAADWSGGDASKGEGGEALTVVDKTEAWVFHVIADDTGASAVWAAQRVKDDHVSIHIIIIGLLFNSLYMSCCNSYGSDENDLRCVSLESPFVVRFMAGILMVVARRPL